MEFNENQKKFIKIGLYIGGLILIVLFLKLSEYSVEKNNEKLLEFNQSLYETIKNINDDYYSSKVQLVLDDDAISLDYEKLSVLEMGTKKYHGNTTEYIKKDNIYYSFDNGVFQRIENFVDFDYDKTFMNLGIIKKMLNLNKEAKSFKNDEYQVAKLEYELEEILPLYNEFNNTNVMKMGDVSVTLEIYSNNNKIEFLFVNTTEFYNLINDTDLKNVIYKIEFKLENEEDISWILEKLN